MRAISLATGTSSAAAAAFNASQNSPSSEIDVRWPAMLNERLTGRLIAASLGTRRRRESVGAAAGAVLGEVIGGDAAKGAVIGGAAGTGVVLATKGKEVEIPAGTELQCTLAAPLAVTITKTIAP